MKLSTLTQMAGSMAVAGMLLAPVAMRAQESQADAKAQVDAHDAKHHTKAKIVGGSAAGGAVAGAAVAGPAGAVVGAGVGATTGLVANHIHKKHQVKKQEAVGTPTTPQ